MAMYSLEVLPLIHRLRSAHPSVSQVRYANDPTGVSTFSSLRKWCTLSKHEPLLGCNSNALKTYIVVKDKYAAAARHAFTGTLLLQLMGKGTWVL